MKDKLSSRYNYLFIVAPILILAMANSSWLFDSGRYIDSYMYLAYFFKYADHVTELDMGYKSSRLPWIIPGYLIFKFFPPFIAHFVLITTTVFSLLASLFLFLRTRLSVSISIVTVMSFSVYSYFHHSGGWYYHNFASQAYLFLAFFLLIKSVRGSNLYQTLGASVLFSLALHTNILIAFFVPLLVLFFFAFRYQNEARFFYKAVITGIAGFALTTLVLGLVNVLSGGQFLFFMPQLNIVLDVAKVDPNSRNFSDWIYGAFHLATPLTLSIGLLIVFTLRMIKGTFNWRDYAFSLAFLLIMVELIIAEFSGVAMIQDQMIGFIFCCIMFAAFAELLYTLYSELNLKARDFILITLILVIPLIFRLPLPFVTEISQIPILILLVIIGCFAASIILRSKWKFLVLIVLFSVFNQAICAHHAYSDNSKINAHRITLDCYQFIEKYDPDMQALFWFDPSEKEHIMNMTLDYGRLFDNVAATRNHGTFIFIINKGARLTDISTNMKGDNKYHALPSSLLSVDPKMVQWPQKLFIASGDPVVIEEHLDLLQMQLDQPYTLIDSVVFVRDEWSVQLCYLELRN